MTATKLTTVLYQSRSDLHETLYRLGTAVTAARNSEVVPTEEAESLGQIVADLAAVYQRLHDHDLVIDAARDVQDQSYAAAIYA